MKFFINQGIFTHRGGEVKVEIVKLSDSKIKLSIPNYIENEKKHEYVDFIFTGIESLQTEAVLKDVSFYRSGKNKYHIIQQQEDNGVQHMYALIRSEVGDFDDIFIPKSMKEKIEVVRHMRFMDVDNNYQEYLSNIYLVKIKLNMGERIEMYLGYGQRTILKAFFTINRPCWDKERAYYVSQRTRTLIFITTRANVEEYISLSKLINDEKDGYYENLQSN